MAQIEIITGHNTKPDCIIVALYGQMLGDSIAMLRERLNEVDLSTLDRRPMLIDLTGLTHAAVAVLYVLVQLAANRSKSGLQTKFVGPISRRVLGLMELTEPGPAEPVFATRHEALVALSQPAPS